MLGKYDLLRQLQHLWREYIASQLSGKLLSPDARGTVGFFGGLLRGSKSGACTDHASQAKVP